jgi:response regulator RpfG family c-di-GMP phosphodiesterase
MKAVSTATHGPRPRVLCVDDEPVVLQLATRLLDRMGMTAVTAAGPQAALDLFASETFDLILTDIRMPGMDGHAFLAEVRSRNPHVPVIVATGHASLDNAIRALRDGASGMLIKPFTGEEFTSEVSAALLRAKNRYEALQYQFVTPILDGVALALTAAIEARDLETGAHCRQLGSMGEQIAVLLGLGEQERTTIRIGGYLHDVGKIAIADRILLKPGPLTPDEYSEMQRHADIGSDIVSTHDAMGDIARIVRNHHERFDGNGYPDRLHGERIPIGARIISIADAYSAMTNDRPYRKALRVDAAWDEIRRNAGSQFDPELVTLFEAAFREQDLATERAATNAPAAGPTVTSGERTAAAHAPRLRPSRPAARPVALRAQPRSGRTA